MTTVWQRLTQGGSILTLAAAVLSLIVLADPPAAEAQSETPAKFMQRVANQLIAAQRSGSEGDYATVL
ncbi:hypothetical protein, partial [Vibrio cholerae]|uniref:hypothetical protein n=1 Tax=Vibrio cholerae TaxID=666 RepID=UPI0018F0ABE1